MQNINIILWFSLNLHVGYQEKDAAAADFEEEEARNIQKRLAEQLDDDDFSLEIFDKVRLRLFQDIT